MSSFCISSKLFDSHFEDSSFVLNDSQLKTSQLVQSFCEQATEVAPLCGMMLGNLAAPFVRFQSSRLLGQVLGKEGLFRSVSHVGSWLCGVSTEGFLMTATPGWMRGEALGVSLWRGTTHATLTMMVCEGISKRLPLRGGVLGACGQDLGVMLVNWGTGELNISEKATGGFVDQLVEARVMSMRIGVSGCLVRAGFGHVSWVRAKYELNHQTENISVSRFHGFGVRKFFSSFTFAQEFAANNEMKIKINEIDFGPTKEQAALNLMSFMGRRGETIRRRGGAGAVGGSGVEKVQKDNRKIVLQATAAMREGETSQIKNPQNLASYEALAEIAQRDIYRYEAMITLLNAMRLPGMTKHAMELEAFLNKPRISEADLKEVRSKIEKIVLANPDMRQAYQALLVQRTVRDYLLYAIPNILTGGNVVLALYAMSCFAQGEAWKGLISGMVGGVSDKLDGTVARLLKKTSIVGQKADSKSDGTLFTTAVGGFGVYEILSGMGHPVVGLMVGSIVAISGWARLIKFDIFTEFPELFHVVDWVKNKYDKPSFVGSATTLAPFVLGAGYTFSYDNPLLFSTIALTHAGMMIANLRCPKISDQQLKKLKDPLVAVPLVLPVLGLLAAAYRYARPELIGIPAFVGLEAYAVTPIFQALLRKQTESATAVLSPSPEDSSEFRGEIQRDRIRRKKRR